MIVLFCGLSIALKNVAFSSTIGILITVSMPLTAIAYEEKDGWQKFVIASGTKTSAIIGEKYLLGIVFCLNKYDFLFVYVYACWRDGKPCGRNYCSHLYAIFRIVCRIANGI